MQNCLSKVTDATYLRYFTEHTEQLNKIPHLVSIKEIATLIYHEIAAEGSTLQQLFG